MRTKLFVGALAALALVATGCDKGDLAFAPKACILAGQDAVRKATDNTHLSTNGDSPDDDLDGSVCTYRDAHNRSVVWRFSDDPVSVDEAMEYWRKHYGVHPAGGYSLDSDVAKDTHVLTAKADVRDVRGLVTKYPDIVITVIGPKGATLKQLADLRAVVWDGFTDQGSVAVSGQ